MARFSIGRGREGGPVGICTRSAHTVLQGLCEHAIAFSVFTEIELTRRSSSESTFAGVLARVPPAPHRVTHTDSHHDYTEMAGSHNSAVAQTRGTVSATNSATSVLQTYDRVVC